MNGFIVVTIKVRYAVIALNDILGKRIGRSKIKVPVLVHCGGFYDELIGINTIFII